MRVGTAQRHRWGSFMGRVAAANGGCRCGSSGKVKGAWGHISNPSIAAFKPSKASGEDAAERRVVNLVNQVRARYGLSTLRYEPALDGAAEGHALTMAHTGRMAHSGIGDGTPAQRIRANGFTGAWGENVARGQRSPEQVVHEWMLSPTHRANILNPNFNRLAVAHTTGRDGTHYWAQAFGS